MSFAFVLAAGLSDAQEFPTQPIRIVIPYAAGGGSDILARPVGLTMTERLKQPVVVDNRAGAAGNIGAQLVAQANPDGHTLLLANISHTINPFIYKSPGYDMAADFAPISVLGTSPTIMVVHKGVPATTLREFVALAQKNPGKLNFGSAGVGTPPHLVSLLFNKLTGINLVHIPYKGAGPLATALLQKEIDVVFTTPASAAVYIKSGDFCALAVTSRERFPSYPNVPTVAESGLPGLSDFQMEVWWGLLAPARTDPRVLDTLNAAVTAALRDPKMSERWLADGMVPTPTSRAEFQARIKSDLQKWEKVVRENAITVE
ncbi:MAG: Bug family tripartite tricarboxylate transporter substrate binding protein [Sphingomicrobium sp.]